MFYHLGLAALETQLWIIILTQWPNLDGACKVAYGKAIGSAKLMARWLGSAIKHRKIAKRCPEYISS